MLPDLVPAPRPCVTEKKEQLTPNCVLVLESWPGGRRYPEAAKNQMGQALGTEQSIPVSALVWPTLGGEILRGSGREGEDVPSYRGPWGVVGSCRGTVLQGLAACLPGNHTGRERGLER